MEFDGILSIRIRSVNRLERTGKSISVRMHTFKTE